MKHVRAATSAMLRRYQDFTDDKYLLWMIRTAVENIDNWPIDKSSRWLGFIQGVLSVSKDSGAYGEFVKQELDFFHELFHAAYKLDGIEVPKTEERI